MSTSEKGTSTSQVARGGGAVVSVLLIGAQGFASFTIGTLSLLFMMISDGCHDEPDDPFICSDAGGGVFFAGIALEWLLLIAGVVLSIVLVARAASAGQRTWTKPFIGTAVGLLGVVVMIVTVVISAS